MMEPFVKDNLEEFETEAGLDSDEEPEDLA